MTEVPGTDRDQARENVREETPTAPDDVAGAEADPDDSGQAEDQAKPTPGSTELGTS